MLEVARVLWNEAGNAAGLPSAEDLPLPPKSDEVVPGIDEFSEWKRAAEFSGRSC